MQSPGATLCLACSSSLPPRKVSEDGIFHTPCCDRPICAACLSRNPRLARYNPCLRCLGGVGVVKSHSNPKSPSIAGIPDDVPKNVDGGVHDDDVFAIGDDNDDDEHGSDNEDGLNVTQHISSAQRPASRNASEPLGLPPLSTPQAEPLPVDNNEISAHSGPPKYYIRPGDTLSAISLKFKIDGRALCRLNNLPPSTLRTTPHLLHTRTYLILPPSVKALSTSSSGTQDSALDEQRRVRRDREVAEKRFQTLTKEVDTSIAKVYVSLAEQRNDLEGEYELGKEGSLNPFKETKSPGIPSEGSLEGRAIDRFLDDEEWEARERREGRGVSIPKFPLFEPTAGSSNSQKQGKWSPSWWKLGT